MRRVQPDIGISNEVRAGHEPYRRLRYRRPNLILAYHRNVQSALIIQGRSPGDLVIENGKVVAYRTKVKVFFKYQGKE